MRRPSPEQDAREFAGKHVPLTPEQEALHSRRIASARDAQAREARIARVLREELRHAEERLRVVTECSPRRTVIPIKGRPSKGTRQACPVFLASDWHVEENVDPATVNGLNEYTPEIAEKRGRQFFESVLWLIEKERHETDVREAVLWLGGDLITGYIHEELRENNWLSPTEAILLVEDIVVPGIDFLLARSRLDRLVIPCSYGNHGRTTPRRMIGTGATNSYEWLLYKILARWYADEPRAQFVVADGYHVYLPVFDKVLRFGHGDAIGYQGGVGGITIPINKKIAQWNKARRADADFMGHWHQFQDIGAAVVNGSLIGHNPYAIEIGASFEPPQQAMALIRPVRGKAGVCPVFVT